MTRNFVPAKYRKKERKLDGNIKRIEFARYEGFGEYMLSIFELSPSELKRTKSRVITFELNRRLPCAEIVRRLKKAFGDSI